MVDLDTIKELAAKCDLHELDGYMVSLNKDQDGLMRVSADQFNKFCRMLLQHLS